MYKKKLQNDAINVSFLIPDHCCMFASLSLYLHRLYLFAIHRLFLSIPMAVLYGLPGSPGADSIPFPAAIVLSVAFFIAAVIRLGGYFLPRLHQPSHQPFQLIVSIISLVASGLLLGFVSSRNSMSNSPYLRAIKLKRSDSYWCQIVYICLLIVNIGMVGIYEVYTLNKRHISCANMLIGGSLLANQYDYFPTA
jgi:hypothetical protein